MEEKVKYFQIFFIFSQAKQGVRTHIGYVVFKNRLAADNCKSY